MFRRYLILILVQINVNWKFKGLFICKELQLSDVFIDNKKIVKSHIPAVNTPARIEVLVGQSINTTANESKPHLKHGRPIDVKDKIPRKRKAQEKQVVTDKEAIPRKQVT